MELCGVAVGADRLRVVGLLVTGGPDSIDISDSNPTSLLNERRDFDT